LLSLRSVVLALRAEKNFDGSAVVCMKRHACFLVERGRTFDAPHELSAATRAPPVHARCFEKCYSPPHALKK